MKATLLGFTVPNDLIEEINRTDAFMATQTHRFAWGVVRGLTEAGVEVDLLSAAPVSDYPRNPKRAYPGGRFREHGVEGLFLPFVNLLGLKHLTRWFAAWWVGGRRLRRAKPDWLLVHGVHSPFLWYAVLARRRFGVRAAVFLTDPPGVVLPSDSGLRSRLKKLDIGITKRALAKVDAVIVLAEPLATDFAPGIPSLTMEGLFDVEAWPSDEQIQGADAKSRIVTYAGGLSEEYGVGLLVRAVVSSDDPLLRLQLFGRGPLEDWIREVCATDQRVLPPRLLKPHELGLMYATSTVLVQPRPVEQGFVRYSFPSKLLEYMASGTPVLTTRLTSIPTEYEGLVIWTDDSVEGLEQAIEEVISMPAERRRAIGANASDFVRRNRSTRAQGERMRNFLHALGDVQ
ncbi:glycosyltransferase family 4 protein [Ornithinimicrobium cerasi]|uniref:glycosyltransferase family 4 protein n=1 Tax=Ornithinimicrobium cerasi TaxID=2248773 RepID=UPI000F0105D2|nr:glycosyltransferase family 4 protein [Ornithinimicrobium cerasi]